MLREHVTRHVQPTPLPLPSSQQPLAPSHVSTLTDVVNGLPFRLVFDLLPRLQ